MTELQERDAMTCRACGKEERASEGYPCTGCGRFICNVCSMRGVSMCAECSRGATGGGSAAVPGTDQGSAGKPA